MLDYASELLSAINNYCEDDLESKRILRDLVCIISEKKDISSDPFIKNLLFIASQKMRMFGYNILNGLGENPDKFASSLAVLADESIKNIYRSKVRTNNILDKTQKEIVDFFQNLPCKRMLISAPTSYGKTFLMREILFLNYERYKTVLLVFPTIALLQENAVEMLNFVKEKELDYNVIKSVDSEIDFEQRNIFVFTPERTIQLLAAYPNIEIDFFFYDEIYKIDEDYCTDTIDEKASDTQEVPATFLDINRGKTFRIALYLLAKQVDEYYLAGPNLSRQNFGDGMEKFIRSNNIQVREILFEPTLRIGIEAFGTRIKEKVPFEPDCPIAVSTKLSPKVNDKICDIIEYIEARNYGKTLLYCTTPAKANEYASKLAVAHKDVNNIELPKRMQLFLAHIRRTYDIDDSVNSWSLVKVLEKGFGMHHGKLPKYIQSEILNQFNHGTFNILFCTSTIVEGVNTSARNMVILNDKKGSELLTPFDIKNIKGRAGRYYHSFIGRIFYMKKNLLEIENERDLVLDFATYSDAQLDGVDLDNAELVDLTEKNQRAKIQHDLKTKDYKLPEDVFYKNRLVPKEQQEQLLNLLLADDEHFERYTRLIHNSNLCESFLEYNYLWKVLNTFSVAGLLDELSMNRFAKIGKTYYESGLYGLLKWEIDYSRYPDARRHISIDQAYSNAFRTLKDIVEHKIPQILSLFESIFSCAAKIKGIDVGEFSLSKVKRFYETGVRSPFGEYLVEYGFPLDTIRRIEKILPSILTISELEAKKVCFAHRERLLQVLDSYERLLFNDALASLG